MTSKKASPPLQDISIAAVFLVWGILFLYAPTYLASLDGVGQTIFNALGGLALGVGFIGALFELSKLWKNEGLSYWAVGLVFLFPAIGLHIAIMFTSPVPPWETVIRGAVLLFAFLGLPFMVISLPYLFWRPATEPQAFELSAEEIVKKKAAKRKADVNTVLNLLITILTLVVAIIKLAFG